MLYSQLCFVLKSAWNSIYAIFAFVFFLFYSFLCSCSPWITQILRTLFCVYTNCQELFTSLSKALPDNSYTCAFRPLCVKNRSLIWVICVHTAYSTRVSQHCHPPLAVATRGSRSSDTRLLQSVALGSRGIVTRVSRHCHPSLVASSSSTSDLVIRAVGGKLLFC